MHAVTAPTLLSRMPVILPTPRAPGGDRRLHGGDDLWTQARHRVEDRLVARPVDERTEVREIEQSPLLPRSEMHDDHVSLGHDGAPVLGGAPVEGPIRLQALHDDGPPLHERGGPRTPRACRISPAMMNESPSYPDATANRSACPIFFHIDQLISLKSILLRTRTECYIFLPPRAKAPPGPAHRYQHRTGPPGSGATCRRATGSRWHWRHRARCWIPATGAQERERCSQPSAAENWRAERSTPVGRRFVRASASQEPSSRA
jgi:hypothetical protein